jgi:hypothetical protein
MDWACCLPEPDVLVGAHLIKHNPEGLSQGADHEQVFGDFVVSPASSLDLLDADNAVALVLCNFSLKYFL